MDIGIGLPNTLTAPGPLFVDWARRAEERGFSMLGTLDRIVYPSFDSLTSLAVAAGATSRIGLFTNILLAPLYQPVLLAKATASLAALSGGRFTLGVGVGGRPDDYAAAERPLQRRGRLMDETLDLLTRAWAGENVTGDDFPVVPDVPGSRVPVLIGGTTDAAVRRTVAYGDGWTGGGGGPAAAAPMVTKIRQAWQEAGRDGEPRIAALVYYGLGDEKASTESLRRYYAFLGDWVDAIVNGAVRTPQAAKDIARDFAGVGVTEVVFVPTVAALDEVDRLGDAVL
jgi:alkanesulfonate monooxygenase SsuD/methylene tetrahydromethanopterin reductase-like flavin-dependent oxidoreductase (luciferase family)